MARARRPRRSSKASLAEGRQAKAFAADLADWDAAAGLVDRVVAEFGAPTLLVNCAALFLPDTAADFEQEPVAQAVRRQS